MNSKDILEFSATRKLVVQYKHFLTILENLQEEYRSNFQRLFDVYEQKEKKIGKINTDITLLDNLYQADWFTDDRMQLLRKNILDLGNDLKRELETEFAAYDIEIKH
jgi:hypothetical protein